jgi:hypothetical protein
MKKYTCIVVKWFDRLYGNTYHSCRIIRHSDNEVLLCPFTYGYGEQYRQTALTKMIESGWITEYTKDEMYIYERENDYPIIWVVSDGLKRECVANGKD